MPVESTAALLQNHTAAANDDRFIDAVPSPVRGFVLQSTGGVDERV
jgi:hypothetical protein